MCAHDGRLYANNNCRECDIGRQEKYRKRQKLGMALLRAAEARGLSVDAAVAVLQNLDGPTLQEYRGVR